MVMETGKLGKISQIWLKGIDALMKKWFFRCINTDAYYKSVNQTLAFTCQWMWRSGSHDQFTLIEMACYDWTEQEMQFFFLQIIKATIIFISKEHQKLDLYKKFCTCILLFQSGV